MTYYEILTRIANEALEENRLADFQSALECIANEVWNRYDKETDTLTRPSGRLHGEG